jgi:beta-N-acetylhexosaminidase
MALLLSFSCALTTASEIEPDLDTRIGQMIMTGFRGLAVTDDSAVSRDIVDRHIGGIILFDYDVPSATFIRNIDTEEQLKNLVSSLQSRASIPLLVAIDQEGGKVNRLKEVYGFPPTLSQQHLGIIDDLQKTTAEAEQTAALLARTGINLNLAPVIDLNSNPQNPIIGKVERSFSADPVVVTRHAMAVIDAHHSFGILTALKHFPGQGSANGDTQKGIVDVTKQWSLVELEPFHNLIKEGKADLIMTSHLVNRRLDPAWPASLSSKTVTDLLRRDMGFDGVVISDDLQMKSITGRYNLDTAITQAILAGADIIILANNSVYDEDVARCAVSAIKRSIQRGYLTEDRINKSWQRIRKLKDRLEKQPGNETSK